MKLYSWLFVNTIPLLVEEKKIERQSKIETWLNLYQITPRTKHPKTNKQQRKHTNKLHILSEKLFQLKEKKRK